MPQKVLDLVMGAVENETAESSRGERKGLVISVRGALPGDRRMQLSQTQTGMLLRAGKSRSQIREDIKYGGPFPVACAAAATKESFL